MGVVCVVKMPQYLLYVEETRGMLKLSNQIALFDVNISHTHLLGGEK